MIIHMMEQHSPEWYEIRKLKFTASHANTILAMGKGVETLIDEMLAEYYSSGNYEEYSVKFNGKQMQRGNNYEDKARKIYELETGNKVQQVGFVELSTHVGCSPDGFIGEDGLIEIKNPSDTVFLKLIETNKIKKEYIDQMQYQMFVTNRQWCDFFAFNPNFDPCFVKIRVERDIDYQVKMTEAIPHAEKLLLMKKEKFDKILKVA